MQKYKRSIVQVGNLLGISFPKGWSDFYKLKTKEKVELVTGEGEITIKLLEGEL